MKYQARVRRITEGTIEVEADSYDIAWDLVQESTEDFVEGDTTFNVEGVYEVLPPLGISVGEEIKNTDGLVRPINK